MRRKAIKLKRVYEKPGPEDGLRVLIDRIWPRGLSRRAVAADVWLKEAAPSPELRRWFGHDPRRWKGFCRRYRAELAKRPQVLRLLDDLCRRAPVTLLYSAADTAHNNAVALREILKDSAPRHAGEPR